MRGRDIPARIAAHLQKTGSRVDRMRSPVRPMKERERVRALEALGAAERARLAWAVAAHPAQRAPRACADGGDWSTWLFLGGRGAGKTRAGAEWVWEVAEALGARGLGSGARIALVGATMHDVRSVMVEGPSGLMNLPFRPGGGRAGLKFEPSLRRVVFPGGAVGMLFSAEEPERLRGPQFHAAWGDELCAWGRGAETLANLRLGLRLGADARDAVARCLSAGLGADARLAEPRCMSAGDPLNLREETAGWTPRLMLTTTPKPTRVLRTLLAEPGLVRTDAPTGANAANLAPGFLATMQALYVRWDAAGGAGAGRAGAGDRGDAVPAGGYRAGESSWRGLPPFGRLEPRDGGRTGRPFPRPLRPGGGGGRSAGRDPVGTAEGRVRDRGGRMRRPGTVAAGRGAGGPDDTGPVARGLGPAGEGDGRGARGLSGGGRGQSGRGHGRGRAEGRRAGRAGEAGSRRAGQGRAGRTCGGPV